MKRGVKNWLPEKHLRLLVVMLFAAGTAAAQAQSQTAASPSQTTSGSQAAPQANQESVGDAARKAKADKGKSKARKVYTDEDLPTAGHTISVVGDANASGDASRQAENSEVKSGSSDAAKQEQYWRGRAQKIREQMNALDEQIAKLKDDIKKNGASGFDASSGLQKNVIYVDDKNARLQRMEQKRAELDKQMDQLQEEGRKAGASPSWFR